MTLLAGDLQKRGCVFKNGRYLICMSPSKPKPKAAIYVRVSTDEQNYENQLPVLKEMAANRGWEIVATFAEKESGAKKGRPALNEMKEAARKGQFKFILVWALDRLGRTMFATLETVLNLDEIGVMVISHQEGWLEQAGALRPVLVSFVSWVAQQERERLIERTNAGLARAKAEGKTLGRRPLTTSIDDILKLRAEGHSVHEVAARLGISVGSVHNRLKSDDVPQSARDRVPRSMVEQPVKAAGPRTRVRGMGR